MSLHLQYNIEMNKEIKTTNEAYLKYSLHELRFSNDFVKVENNQIVFKSFYNKRAFEIIDINKIFLKKERLFQHNIISIVIGIILGITAFSTIEITIKLLLTVSSMMFFIFSIVYKKYTHNLILIMKSNIIKIKVDSYQKNEAKHLVKQINKYSIK